MLLDYYSVFNGKTPHASLCGCNGKLERILPPSWGSKRRMTRLIIGFVNPQKISAVYHTYFTIIIILSLFVFYCAIQLFLRQMFLTMLVFTVTFCVSPVSFMYRLFVSGKKRFPPKTRQPLIYSRMLLNSKWPLFRFNSSF